MRIITSGKAVAATQSHVARRSLWFVAIYAASVITFAGLCGLLSLLLPK